MRWLLFSFALIGLTAILVVGRRGDVSRRPPIELFPDMVRQPRLQPQTANRTFVDGLSSQPSVAGTVARGSAYEDTPYNTGKVTGATNWVEILPERMTAELLGRGQENYTVYCAICHGAGGDGKGITTRPMYGMVYVANLHDPRIVRLPDGLIFSTIIHGSPAQLMLGYGSQTTIAERWSIVAYVRALQRARLALIDEVPADARQELMKSLTPGAAGGAKKTWRPRRTIQCRQPTRARPSFRPGAACRGY
jgi:mono/diheme cytochrome c family protein